MLWLRRETAFRSRMTPAAPKGLRSRSNQLWRRFPVVNQETAWTQGTAQAQLRLSDRGPALSPNAALPEAKSGTPGRRVRPSWDTVKRCPSSGSYGNTLQYLDCFTGELQLFFIEGSGEQDSIPYEHDVSGEVCNS